VVLLGAGGRSRRLPSSEKLASTFSVAAMQEDALRLAVMDRIGTMLDYGEHSTWRVPLHRIIKCRTLNPSFTRNTADQHPAVLKPSSDHAIAAPETNDQSEREKLIRRRWSETGIKMWNPDVNGAGHAALNIQGRAELLPPKPGETLPGYDTLEFKMVRSCVNGQEMNRIVCEGVVVAPPNRRARHLTTGTGMTIIGT
jgi:hypothetical protein